MGHSREGGGGWGSGCKTIKISVPDKLVFFTSKLSLKAQWQILDIWRGASSLGVKFTKIFLAWYDK